MLQAKFVRGGLALVVLFAAATGVVQAFSGGVTGFSGQFGSDCNVCHSGGVIPMTTITGPTSVAPGSVNVYTLTIDVPVSPTNQRAGGLDVSTDGGVLSHFEAGTNTSGGEIIHTTPRSMNASREVIFQFNWEAPLNPGTYTLFGAGNAVNLGQGNGGDAAQATTLQIDVAGAGPTPGESSGAGLSPLLVSGYDGGTGNLSIAYDSGCEATSNNLYFGPLNQVSTYGYTGEDCDIGIGGSYATFNPGADSYFFVLVGTKSADEGSYGLDLQFGSQNERPDFVANVCGQAQSLADRCD